MPGGQDRGRGGTRSSDWAPGAGACESVIMDKGSDLSKLPLSLV